MTKSSFYGGSTAYPDDLGPVVPEETNRDPETPRVPSSFYPEGGVYDAIDLATTAVHDIQEARDAAAASAVSAARSASAAATSASNAAEVLTSAVRHDTTQSLSPTAKARARQNVGLPGATVAGRLMRFTGTDGSVGQTSALVEDANGNVGVGTSNPAHKLDVSGDINGVRLRYNGVLTREVLAGTRYFYVRTDGHDGNTGLVNTPSGAFRTIQKAVDVASSLDCMGQAVVILVTGSHTESTDLRTILGASSITIIGNEADPASVTITGAGPWCFRALDVVGNWYLRGMRLVCPVAGSGSIIGIGNMTTTRFYNLDFGASSGHQIAAQFGARVQAEGNYSISGGAIYHAVADGGLVYIGNRTVTLTGVPHFTGCFVLAQKGTGIIDAGLITFVGAATGTRFVAQSGGQISTIGAGQNYFPGNAPGVGSNFAVAPYGQYS